MRVVSSPTGIRYVLYETPADLAALTNAVARQPRIWIDTEVADWNTPSPRLSLIQLRLEDGSLHVVDVLSPGVAAACDAWFVPNVLGAERIEKWAHYARFERRVFGAHRVSNLNCTYELARSVRYHRLPLRSLSLASLVFHFFQRVIDKSLQRADWGRRPLSAEMLDYAAWDPEWCYWVSQHLRPLVPCFDPRADHPPAIHARYLEILPTLRDANHWRSAIWDAVKAFMMQAGRERFAHFLLQDRVIRTIPIRDLANAVSEVDPMGIVDFSVQVPNALSDWLRTGGKAALRETGVETIPTRFIGPRAPRATSKRSYVVDGGNPVRVAADYSEALHHHQMMEAERDELKGRMRAWMTHAGVSRWGPFEIGQGSPKLTADVRIVAEWLRAEGSPTTGLPARFLVGFSDSQLLALSKYVDSNSTPVLRWRPNGNALTIDVVQSRDWYDDDDGP